MLSTFFNQCCGLARKSQATERSARALKVSSAASGLVRRRSSLEAAYARVCKRSKHVVLGRELTAGKRVVIIGDVHGCAEELDLLLAKIDFKRDGSDIAVFVGDLVAKGPDSQRVVRTAMALNAYGVRGNHDHYVIRNFFEPKPDDGSDHWKLSNGGLTPNQIEWLAHLPMSVEIEEHKVIVVHAGLLPGLHPREMSDEDLMHMRNIIKSADSTMTVTSNPTEGCPWVELYEGPKHIVFGHDAKRKLQQTQHATGLDTGCLYGGELSALVLPAKEIVSVRAVRVHQAPSSAKLKQKQISKA